MAMRSGDEGVVGEACSRCALSGVPAGVKAVLLCDTRHMY